MNLVGPFHGRIFCDSEYSEGFVFSVLADKISLSVLKYSTHNSYTISPNWLLNSQNDRALHYGSICKQLIKH